MRANFQALTLALSVFILGSCIGAGGVKPDSPLPAEHQWTRQQLALIDSLSLNSLPPRIDRTNRVAASPQAARFGQRVFFDIRFSRNGDIACASCHKPELYFTDGLKTAFGLEQTKRNTPTVVGASFNTWFFWDGRSDSLWAQALGPLENPLEHGGNRSRYAHIVYDDPALRSEYEFLFGVMPNLSDLQRFPIDAGPVSDKTAENAWLRMRDEDRVRVTEVFVNLGKAVAAYESQLQPGLSRFDRYAQAAISDDREKMLELLASDEAAGLRIFIGKGTCVVCHNGPMFTDNGFHNIATPSADGESYDWGRYLGVQQVKESSVNCLSEYNDAPEAPCKEMKYLVTEKEETLGSMKTPGLRNVALTPPYMHAGQYKTLAEVIEHYVDPPSLSYRQSDLLEIKLNKKEKQQLEAFLRTLDGGVAASQNPFSLTLSPDVK